MASRNYRDLIAWQKAMDLVMAVYRASENSPKQELYGLTSQVRRAAVSTPSNIAEGQGRRTNRDFCNFLSIAHGSLREVETQIFIASRLEYIDGQLTSDLIDSAAEDRSSDQRPLQLTLSQHLTALCLPPTAHCLLLTAAPATTERPAARRCLQERESARERREQAMTARVLPPAELARAWIPRAGAVPRSERSSGEPG